MCGVTGYLNLDQKPSDHIILAKMTESLEHRGPDGFGYFTDGPIGLGHSRLKIIDFSDAAAQPMKSKNGRWSFSYNGEIYNFREMRCELEGYGIRFRSSGDTEVVLEALAYWGPAAVSKFNGMFAFALWDSAEKRLILARDRYGIKPMYYADLGRHFIFGSEVKAILKHPAISASMDKEALLEYMTFQNFFTDKTLFKNVKMLPAGCYLTIQEGKAAQFERYWDFRFEEPEQKLSNEEYSEELFRLFEQAVQRQEVSDVTVGSYLSGGIDTGAITSVASRDLKGMPTFTVGFDMSSASALEQGYDERVLAEHMSYVFQTEHYEMVLKAGDMERILPKVVEHLEEPRVGQCYPNYFAAKLARGFSKVVFSGTGGDELFGGYPWRYYRPDKSSNFDSFVDEYYIYWQRLIPNRTIKAAFRPIWSDVSDVWTRDIFSYVFQGHQGELNHPADYLNNCLYFECKTFLHGLLAVEDRLSMAHGLETRVPFLDNDLVDFATKLPYQCKISSSDEQPRLDENILKKKSAKIHHANKNGKPLLRSTMQNYLPKSISDAPKQGFSAPDSSWFRGESMDFVRRRLINSDARIYEYLDRDVIHNLVNEHLDGHQNRRLLIWSLIYLEQWIETFMEHSS